MNKIVPITGDEQVHPLTWDKSYNATMETEQGITLKQFALLKFMCALIKDTTLPHGSEDDINWLVKTASLLTDAYINELNK